MSVSTTSTDPPQAVIDILQGYSGWTNTTPEVYRQQEVPQSERESASEPRIYVWSPVDASLDGFDMEYNSTTDEYVVEANIWILNESDASDYTACREYADDIVSLFEDYARDNYNNTEFEFIRPDTVTDARSESIARKTDHTIMSVELTVHRLRDSGT